MSRRTKVVLQFLGMKKSCISPSIRNEKELHICRMPSIVSPYFKRMIILYCIAHWKHLEVIALRDSRIYRMEQSNSPTCEFRYLHRVNRVYSFNCAKHPANLLFTPVMICCALESERHAIHGFGSKQMVVIRAAVGKRNLID